MPIPQPIWGDYTHFLTNIFCFAEGRVAVQPCLLQGGKKAKTYSK